MYIVDLHVGGYGRLSNLRLEPSRGLNILHGPAESGKSTICNCLRDLLLGPGRWDSPDGGPRAPHAKPRGGGRFQVRVSYRVGPAGFTVLRDLDSLVTRARDDGAGSELDDVDGRGPAPGVTVFHLDESALPPLPTVEIVFDDRLRAARERATQARGEVVAWEYRHDAAVVADLEGRLCGVAALRTELEGLRDILAQHAPYAGVARERRDPVIRTGERYRAAEREHAELQSSLERKVQERRELGTRLTAYERFYTVTEADLEMVKTLEVSEGPAALIAEKVKNLEGFRQKEADIEIRLAEVGPRFAGVIDHDAYDAAITDHERDLRLNEKLALKTAERDRVRASMQIARASLARMLGLGLIFVLVGAALIGSGMAPTRGGLSALVGLGLLMKMVANRERMRALEDDDARLARDIDALQNIVDNARGELRRIIEAVGAHTIQETRLLHRELRSLLRDAETVRSYRAAIEHDLEEARKEQAGRRVESPRLLIECGVLTPGEPPTPHAVAEFFDAYLNFKALRQEEEILQKGLAQLRGEMEQKSRERDALKADLDAALQEMGVASEAEMETAVAGRREYDRVKAQVDVLEEKVLVALRGLDEPAVTRLVESARARLRALAEAHPQLAAIVGEADAVEQHGERLRAAQQVLATAQGEIAALEGRAIRDEVPVMAALEAGVSPDRYERSVAEAWLRITARPLEMRARESQGRTVIDVREHGDQPWMPPSALGSVSSRLLAVLAEGERTRLGGGGMLPFMADNPLSLLAPDWRARLADWLVDLSDTVQLFITLSTPDARDLLLEAVRRRGGEVREIRQDGIDFHMVAPCGAASS